MPDEKDKPQGQSGDHTMGYSFDRALVPMPAEPDPANDQLIDDLQAEAEPKPKRCPHCGGELPRE